MTVKLEVNTSHVDRTTDLGTLVVCPIVSPDYWLFRVDVGHGQAVIGFRKFSTIGVGFQHERDDWNTNLPWSCAASEIYAHIRKNKGKGPTKTRCILAIKAIQRAVIEMLPEMPKRTHMHDYKKELDL